MNETNLNSNNGTPTNSTKTKKWIIGVLIVLLLSGVFQVGYVFGQRGYVFSASEFKVQTTSGDSPADYNLLWQALEIVRRKYIDRDNIDQQKVLYGAIQGAVSAAGDEYTEFFDPETLAQFRSDLQGTFSGIGAEIGKRNNNIVIVAPLDDTPASRAGLQPQDIIVAINGENTSEMNTDQAVSKIRGEAGSEVTLTLFREGKGAPFDVKLVRQKIEVKSVKLSYKEVSGQQIAVLTISRFGDDTVTAFRMAALEIQAKKPAGVVVDLRNNPGGYLDAAVDIGSQWLEKGKLIVKEAHSEKDTTDFNSSGENTLGGFKTVILLNGGSASASEILAGALKDNGKAKIVGEKSFGKGSVQELVPLGKDMAVKVTIAKWITPSGKHLNKDGIEPDVKVELTEENINNKQDPQLDKALEEVLK